MQRRAATVYAVLFLVIAAGAYSLIGVAEEPAIDLEGETYAQGQNVTVNGFTYNVSSADASQGEGTLTRVNESSLYTESLANNSTTEIANETYRVLIPNTSDPGEFTLRQEFELGENTSTVSRDDTEYVVVNGTDGNQTLVPRDRYERQQFGQPDTQTYAEGDTFDYAGNETTVTNVTVDAAQLQYTAPRTVETGLSDGGEVDLGPENDNRTFVAHFTNETIDGNTTAVVQLSPETDAYDEQVEERDQFNERMAGLWGIVILSAITLVLLLGMAFLPNK